MSKPIFKFKLSAITIAIIVFMLILGLVYFFNMPIPVLQTGIGGSVWSCTQPELINGDPVLGDGKIFKCLMSGANYGQHLEITSEEAESLFGIKTEQKATIYPEVLNLRCEYGMLNESNVVYQINTDTDTPVKKTSGNDCNFCACRSGFTADSTKGCYQGTFGSSYCNPSARVGYDCIKAIKYGIGEVRELDTGVTAYDLKVTMELEDGTKYDTIVSWDSIASKVSDRIRVQLQGDLAGPFDCPAPNAVAYIPNNENKIYLKSKNTWSALYNNMLGIPSDTTGLFYEATRQNNLVNNFLTSSPVFSNLCPVDQTSLTQSTQAKFACIPVQPNRIPVFLLYIKADTLGEYIPNGTPQINGIEVEHPDMASDAVTVDVSVTSLNDGDTYEANLKCSKDITPFASTKYIGKDKTETISIQYKAAGYIDVCTVEVKSVNNPDNKDIGEAKIKVEPFCGKPQPSPNAIKVSTDNGCFWICPKYGENDVVDAGCKDITTYDRCTNYEQSGIAKITCTEYKASASLLYEPVIQDYQFDGCEDMPDCESTLPAPSSEGEKYTCKETTYSKGGCLDYVSYLGYHCIGIGQAVDTDNYMDGVFREKIDPFIPVIQPHKYFIVSDQGEVKCQWVNEFGYDSSGQELLSFESDASIGLNDATISEIPETSPSPPSESGSSTHLDDSPGLGFTIDMTLIMFLLAVIGGMAGLVQIFRK